MNARQRYALTNPLSDPRVDEARLDRLTRHHQRGDGSLLTVILAVDR